LNWLTTTSLWKASESFLNGIREKKIRRGDTLTGRRG
jgi:hypothetical protein